MPRPIANLDFESRSACELSQAGAHRYSQHPSTEVMMLAYSINLSEPALWVPGDPFPDDLRHVINEGGIFEAWNAQFERVMWKIMERYHGAMPVPLNQWCCTMVRALLMGFPGKLDKAGPSMGLGQCKDEAGHRLMLQVSKPRKVYREGDEGYESAYDATPLKAFGQSGLAEFTSYWDADAGEMAVCQWWVDADRIGRVQQYCRQDVRTEQAASQFLDPIPPMEHAAWCLDQRINDRGFYLDMELVRNARKLIKPATAVANRELAELTGGALKSVTKVAEVKTWLEGQLEVTLPGVDKDTLNDLLYQYGDDMPQHVRDVIVLRLAAAKTSTAKLNAMVRGVSSDGRIHGGLQFAGAGRTNRWAGRLVQPHNMPSPPKWAPLAVDSVLAGRLREVELVFDTPLEAISAILRSCITAEPGNELHAADYNAIESRIVAWLADCVALLDAYRTGKDPYRMTVAQLYAIADWTTIAKTDQKRQLGKKIVLGCGFQMGKKRFRSSCQEGKEPLYIDEELAERAVNTYRTAYPEIPDAWYELERAAIRAAKGEAVPALGGKVWFYRDDRFLRCRLPSGRVLSYLSPDVRVEETPWGTPAEKLYFWGWNGQKNRMEWQAMYGGRWMENCLAEGTEVLTDRGWVPIEQVRDTDQVHDGVELVNHGGVIYKSIQKCVSIDGVGMTPDHEVLTDEGWQAASQNPRPFRPNVRPADVLASRSQRWKEAGLAFSLRLWRRSCASYVRRGEGGASRANASLRSLCQLGGRGSQQKSRYERAPGISCMAEYARPVPPTVAPGMAQLRSAWHKSVRALDEVRGILARHGAGISTRADAGSPGQRRTLCPGKLPMGGLSYPGRKPSVESSGGHTEGPKADGRKPFDALLSVGEQPVYDIADAGPRARFVVRGHEGPFIVHNCTQATARDVLLDGMVRLDAQGWNIILTVHDEVVDEEKIGARRLRDMIDIMSQPPAWAPDLPLAVEGWTGQRYRK